MCLEFIKIVASAATWILWRKFTRFEFFTRLNFRLTSLAWIFLYSMAHTNVSHPTECGEPKNERKRTVDRQKIGKKVFLTCQTHKKVSRQNLKVIFNEFKIFSCCASLMMDGCMCELLCDL